MMNKKCATYDEKPKAKVRDYELALPGLRANYENGVLLK